MTLKWIKSIKVPHWYNYTYTFNTYGLILGTRKNFVSDQHKLQNIYYKNTLSDFTVYIIENFGIKNVYTVPVKQ